MTGEYSVNYDLTMDEARRRDAVMKVIGDEWDPIEALAGEELANNMLYSGLDGSQVQIYHALVAAGVLPDRPESELTKPVQSSFRRK